MTSTVWALDASSGGTLSIRTGVTGRASKMGHRLTIGVTKWHATVEWDGRRPTAVTLTAEVPSIEVLGGEGGVTPLIGPEKMVAKSNALKTFDADRFPEIKFRSDDVTESGSGYTLNGSLEIHGKTKKVVVDVAVEDQGRSWRIRSENTVKQTDYGIKPYSQLMGSMKVVDDVTVRFEAEHSK
ncbi:polyisoprenoid-binding protein [Rhodococcoides trifolii]|uniref:Polyisoprenoid-binding protein n=1 Tax=Rhodococcoides trifolii TaxID=908250 RepID=A0A917G005_9NOCA|nr:YceI family protein [Rhodococcus trifolii]GGG15899.1 polyisoprenoid-binding protein [Rhodococcus trifolii]